MPIWLEPYWIMAMSVAGAVLGLCFLIFVHELGHFLVAKISGVKVEVFSLGVGHFMFSWSWRGTVYALSWLPLGGYVRMAGQQDLAPPPSHKPRSWEYGAKKPLVRMAIIVAGVTMNFIFGWLCYSAAFMVGRDVQVPVVGRLSPERYSSQLALDAGLLEGDRIVRVNGDRVHSLPGLEMRVGRESPGGLDQPSWVDVTVERQDGAVVREVTVRVEVAEGRFRGVATIEHLLGDMSSEPIPVRVGFGTERRVVIQPVTGLLAANAEWAEKLRPGEFVTAINGVAVSRNEDIRRAMRESEDGQFELTLSMPDGLQRQAAITGEKGAKSGFEVGVVGGNYPGPMVVDRVLASSPAEAAGLRAGDQVILPGQTEPCTFQEFTREIGTCGTGPLRIRARSRLDGGVRELVLHPRRSWSIPCGESDVVSEVLPGSVAEDKGLRRGAVIESLSTDIAGRDPAVVVWYHAGRKFGPYALPRLPDGPSVTFGLPRNTENLRIGRLDEALAAGWGETRETVLQTSVLLKKIVGRRTTPEIMMGPLGIAQAAYTLAGKGLGHMLWLLGVIGISLAMINLLPIPVLDGGHLAFLCYEAVFRRQPSQRVMEVAQYAGLLIILALFGFAFWNDISRTFGIGGG